MSTTLEDLIPSTETGYVFLYLFSTVTEEVALESAGCECTHTVTCDGCGAECTWDTTTNGWVCGSGCSCGTACGRGCGYGEDIVYTDPETGKTYVIAESNENYETFLGLPLRNVFTRTPSPGGRTSRTTPICMMIRAI